MLCCRDTQNANRILKGYMCVQENTDTYLLTTQKSKLASPDASSFGNLMKYNKNRQFGFVPYPKYVNCAHFGYKYVQIMYPNLGHFKD